MPGIFNRAIFNDAIFNTAPVSTEQTNTGGSSRRRKYDDYVYPPFPRSKEDIRRSREEFGVIPKAAEIVIEQVARKEAFRPKEDAEQALRDALLERDLEFLRAKYLAKLHEEIRIYRQRIAANEEEEVALLLLMS